MPIAKATAQLAVCHIARLVNNQTSGGERNQVVTSTNLLAHDLSLVLVDELKQRDDH